jgi:hypothetical protein
MSTPRRARARCAGRARPCRAGPEAVKMVIDAGDAVDVLGDARRRDLHVLGRGRYGARRRALGGFLGARARGAKKKRRQRERPRERSRERTRCRSTCLPFPSPPSRSPMRSGYSPPAPPTSADDEGFSSNCGPYRLDDGTVKNVPTAITIRRGRARSPLRASWIRSVTPASASCGGRPSSGEGGKIRGVPLRIVMRAGAGSCAARAARRSCR